MRILCVNSTYPSRTRIKEAAHLVAFELMAEMARREGVTVGFLKVSVGTDPDDEQRETFREEYRKAGIEMLEPFRIPAPPPASLPEKVRARLFTRIEDCYPIVSHSGKVEASVQEWRADALFLPWTENCTALLRDSGVKVKYAYYGNPDPKPFRAGQALNRRFSADPLWRRELKTQLGRLYAWSLERHHLDVLRKYDAVGDVALNDVVWYRGKGLDHVHYVRNLWHDSIGGDVMKLKRERESAGNRIVGSVGGLAATANTEGMLLMGGEFMDRFKRRMEGRPFEIHICGGGKARQLVLDQLRPHPEVLFRGFVEDIDLELQQAKVFLNLNNAGPYKVGHTRYLHAWSVGTCIVAHRDAALSMPELEHGYNALLGKDLDDVAFWLAKVLEDGDLRETLALNGRETLDRFFRVGPIVEEILQDMRRIHDLKSAGAQPNQ